MRIIQRLAEMTETARGWLAGGTVGFVPIKGGIHDGHRTLIQAAHNACEICVVSVLANAFTGAQQSVQAGSPAPEHDIQQLQDLGADVVFTPQLNELFPIDFSTYVTPTGQLAECLEGRNNALRVREVVTAVMQLFLLVRPDIAYFGQKDAQYIAILRKMIRDLHVDISLRVLPIVRESDGLAMSMRNHRLSPAERQAARVLYQALLHARQLIEQGELRSQAIIQAITAMIAQEPLLTFEYGALCQPETFAEVPQAAPGTLLVIGARAGTVRLTDNIVWLANGQWQL